MFTRESLTDFAELSAIKEALFRLSNNMSEKIIQSAYGSQDRLDLLDKYQDVMYAFNDVQIKLQIALQKIIEAMTTNSVNEMLTILEGYGIADPRQLNLPLDPTEPINWSNPREWMTDEILEELRRIK